MTSEKSIPTAFRLTPLYRDKLKEQAGQVGQTPSAFAREIVIQHLEGGKSDALADSISGLQAELDALRGELKRLRGVDALRDDLWSVLGTILMQTGNWKEDQVRDLINAYRVGGRGA